jgi:cyclohexyl-isocyanide hydratase
MNERTWQAGLLSFPGITQLDITGPLEVLSRQPGLRTQIVAKSLNPVETNQGLVIRPAVDFARATQFDLLVVPGGPGVDDAILDAGTVDFVRRQGRGSRWIFSICTGSLLLGAAGLLVGRRAGGHWQARDLLSHFGAIVSDERLTVDGNIFSSGGVTAGIDMALRVVAEIAGEDAAKQIQLQIEYDPEPPFRGGTPYTAEPAIVARARSDSAQRRKTREAAVKVAAGNMARN